MRMWNEWFHSSASPFHVKNRSYLIDISLISFIDNYILVQPRLILKSYATIIPLLRTTFPPSRVLKKKKKEEESAREIFDISPFVSARLFPPRGRSKKRKKRGKEGEAKKRKERRDGGGKKEKRQHSKDNIEGRGGGNAETRRSRILLRKQPPRGGRGAFGREKNPAVENVKRKSAVRSQRADVSGRGWRRGRKTLWWLGRETLEKMENGRWCTAEGGVWNCHQRNFSRRWTWSVDDIDGGGIFPLKFFKIVAEFSKISRGIARRRRDYYLKPGKCEWLG